MRDRPGLLCVEVYGGQRGGITVILRARILRYENTPQPKHALPLRKRFDDELIAFPQGLSCVWEVTKPVRKHYEFR